MAEASQINCPHCGQTYFVLPEQWAQYAGQTINCTRCGREFQVTAGAPTAAFTPPTTAQQARPMQSTPMNVGPVSPFAPQPMGYSNAPIPISGWAIASLIVSIAGLCIPLVCSVFAVVAGFIALSQVKRQRARGGGMAIAGIIIGFIGLIFGVLLVIGMVVPTISKTGSTANKIRCQSNLRQIGVSMLAYANTHQRQFPGDLADLANDPAAPATDVYICPDDTRTAPSSATPEELSADLASGNHCSYLYVGAGLTNAEDTDAFDTVLLYEDPALQHNGQINLLYADGHVSEKSANRVKGAIKAAKGRGPIILKDDARQ